MIKIENVLVERDEGDTCYAEILVRLLSMPEDPEAGASWEEVSTIGPIIKKMEGLRPSTRKLPVHIYLDPEEYALLAYRLKSARFKTITSGLYQMCLSVFEAEDLRQLREDGGRELAHVERLAGNKHMEAQEG